MTIAAFFPGAIYFFAPFPLALCIGAVVLSLWAASEHRPLLAGAVGAIALATYPSAFLLVPTLAVLMATDEKYRNAQRGMAPLALLICCCGFGAVLVWHHVAVGHWDAYFITQAKYGHAPTNPLTTLATNVWNAHREGGRGWRNTPAMQSVLVALFVGTTLASAVRAKAYRVPLQLAVMTWTVLLWLFPLSLGAGVSIYRSEALLLPSVLLVKHLPPWMRVGFVIAAVFVFVRMARLYFNETLV